MSSRKMQIVGIVLMLFNLQVTGDVISPNFHLVDRCVVLKNGAQFPDITIIGAYGKGSSNLTRYIVEDNICLTKGLKFNKFYLFWVEKSYLQETGIDELPLEDMVKNVLAKKQFIAQRIGLISSSIEPYGGQVPDSNPLKSEKIEYSLVSKDGINAVITAKSSIDVNGLEKKENFPITTGIKIPNDLNNKANNGIMLNAYQMNGVLFINTSLNGKVTGEILDLGGRTVQKFTRNIDLGKQYSVSCNGIAPGVYWLNIKSNSNTASVKIEIHDK